MDVFVFAVLSAIPLAALWGAYGLHRDTGEGEPYIYRTLWLFVAVIFCVVAVMSFFVLEDVRMTVHHRPAVPAAVTLTYESCAAGAESCMIGWTSAVTVPPGALGNVTKTTPAGRPYLGFNETNKLTPAGEIVTVAQGAAADNYETTVYYFVYPGPGAESFRTVWTMLYVMLLGVSLLLAMREPWALLEAAIPRVGRRGR